ncbi:hypothetical protein ACN4EG_22310, partial [Alkalinema pantanalense CENA528]|uniref:hypothetical protein n=1 Tax=Alkalinema pantanalense TaxID=1620705 RepID=UPI003D6F83CD
IQHEKALGYCFTLSIISQHVYYHSDRNLAWLGCANSTFFSASFPNIHGLVDFYAGITLR